MSDGEEVNWVMGYLIERRGNLRRAGDLFGGWQKDTTLVSSYRDDRGLPICEVLELDARMDVFAILFRLLDKI